MFPNFTSLAQREQKRQELLERVQRRVRQSNAKRQMYEAASWGSDVEKNITTVPKKSTESTQTDISVGPDEETPDELNIPLSEILKKSLIDENSQTNPDLSTPEVEPNVRPVMVDAEVDAEPRMTDGWVNVRPNTTDRNVQARPQTSDSGVNVSPQTTDIGTDGTPQTAEAETNTKIKLVDTEHQVEARSWIKNLFNANPNWVALRIKPMNRKTGKDDNRYFLGESGSLIAIKTGRKGKTYKSIDWVATESKIRDIWYEGESKSIDEVSDMRLEDPLYHASLLEKQRLEKQRFERKRNGDELEDLNVALKDRRLPDITFSRKTTSTTSDDKDSKIKLLWLISKNKEMLESNGLEKSVVPVFKSHGINQDEYVWINNGSIGVYGRESNLIHKTSIKKVSWGSTLAKFLQLIKDRGLELAFVGRSDKELIAMPYQEVDDEDLEARHGIKTGSEEGMDEKLSIADNDAKLLFEQYYRQLLEKEVMIPFRLKPIVDSKNGVKPHLTYYFGKPEPDRALNIRNMDNKPVSGKHWTDLMKVMRWMDTFLALLSGWEDAYRTASDIEAPASEDEVKMIADVNANLKIIRRVIFNNAGDIKDQSVEPYEYDEILQKLHDEAEAAYQEYGEAQKQVEIIQKQLEAVQKNARGTSSTRAKSALKASRSAFSAAKAALRATETVYKTKAKKYHEMVRERYEEEERERNADTFKCKLQGRGLRRGGGVAPLEGVVRRGRTYNLNEIQGLATPSAYVYRQLGSKFIRVPDLDAKSLVIVQPNRRKCGPKRNISDSLQSMIRTLAFKQHIDQAAYDKLTIDDKKLFKEILAITHLQYNFHDRLEDPLDSLRAENDKLKGELELGNDNPSIIKQLKSLSVDMYSNRLISDSEFKDIITRLI